MPLPNVLGTSQAQSRKMMARPASPPKVNMGALGGMAFNAPSAASNQYQHAPPRSNLAPSSQPFQPAQAPLNTSGFGANQSTLQLSKGGRPPPKAQPPVAATPALTAVQLANPYRPAAQAPGSSTKTQGSRLSPLTPGYSSLPTDAQRNPGRNSQTAGRDYVSAPFGTRNEDYASQRAQGSEPYGGNEAQTWTQQDQGQSNPGTQWWQQPQQQPYGGGMNQGFAAVDQYGQGVGGGFDMQTAGPNLPPGMGGQQPQGMSFAPPSFGGPQSPQGRLPFGDDARPAPQPTGNDYGWGATGGGLVPAGALPMNTGAQQPQRHFAAVDKYGKGIGTGYDPNALGGGPPPPSMFGQNQWAFARQPTQQWS